MLWILLGCLSAIFSTIGSIISERTHTSGRNMAAWFRITSVVACLPFVSYFTLPTAWQYWALALFSAAIMGINDALLFNAMKTIGAGATSRFRRTSILLTFILWVIISPSLLLHYLQIPLVGITILGIHILAVFFALRLKKSETSWAALKMLWFPILASSVGPIISKLSFDYVADRTQGAFSYIFIQSIAVLIVYSLYALAKDGWRNVAPGLRSLVADNAWKPGISASLAFVAGIILKHYSYSLVENPAYIAVLLLTDTLWVFIYHKLYGIKDKTDVVSGMGIVACAAALIIIQVVFE